MESIKAFLLDHDGWREAWSATWSSFKMPNLLASDRLFSVKYWIFIGTLTFFWPLWVNLLLAFAAASGWLFWLVTSVALGLVQVGYAAFNFAFIFLDVFGLSVLKTFAMLRSQLLQLSVLSGLEIGRRAGRKGTGRRTWRRNVAAASSYGEFLRIPVQEPDVPPAPAPSPAFGKSKDRGGLLKRTASGGCPFGFGRTNSSPAQEPSAASLNAAPSPFFHREGKDRQSGSISGHARQIMEAPLISEDTAKRDADPTAGTEHEMVDIVRGTSLLLGSKSYDAAEEKGTQESNGNDNNKTNRSLPNSPDRAAAAANTDTIFAKRKKRMRRSTSCMELTHDQISSGWTVTRTGGAGAGTPEDETAKREQQKATIHASRSTANLLGETTSVSSSDEDDDASASSAAEERRYVERVEALLGMRGGMLVATANRLREARLQASSSGGDGDACSSLKFLLAGVVKRNHLGADDVLIGNARSVAESGRCNVPAEAREVVHGFMDEVEACLDHIADAPIVVPPRDGPRGKPPQATTPGPEEGDDGVVDSDPVECGEVAELTDRIKLMSKMKLNTGCSALMLSGGGAQAMYHLGTIRALIEAGVYDDVRVISGTSGGSIAAGMCAVKTPEELHRDVCVSWVSTDYLRTGDMKKHNIRWFPSIWEMGSYWLKHRLLVDSKDFKRCCDFYYGDTTFEEAFQRTGKNVCITVSASRTSAAGGTQRLLLNHISTPHVTISSAVVASCALPGVMKPAKLMAKDREGNQFPFEVDGVEWIDGSVQADLPFKRISTLFNVSNFIVCQVNFHVVPLLNKAHHPGVRSLYWRLFQMFEWDVRSRALNLSRLGLFPRLFGQDVSKVFKQKYHGNITLVPRFTMMQVFGLKALVNPTVEDMEIYLQGGQAAAWPYIKAIKHMLRLENAIESCLLRLEERLQSLPLDVQLEEASKGSDGVPNPSRMAPDRARLGSDKERLRSRLKRLEMENAMLRKKVETLETSLRADSTLALASSTEHVNK